jgi:CRP-like cAMP-binding protein
MLRRHQEAVRANPLFSGCAHDELRAVAGLGTRVHVEEGRVLVRQGQTGTEFFIVVSGVARCEIGGDQVARFGPGDFFGEMAALDRGPRTATVVADSSMDLLVFTPGEFRSLVDASGSIAYRMMVELANRLRRSNAA